MHLSRGIDGDLSDTERRELVDALLTDAELAQRWKRYHAIGDYMREGPLPVDISARVSAALADEAPLAGGNVLSLAAFAGGRRKRLAQPVVGLALAASVAVATVVGLRVLWPQGTVTAPASTASAGAPRQLLEGPTAGSQLAGLPERAGTGLAVAPDQGGVLPAGEVLLVNQGADGSLTSSAAAPETGAAAPAQARLAEYLDRHERRAAAGLLLEAGTSAPEETRP